MKIFLCNIDNSKSQQELIDLLSKFGYVKSFTLVTDKETGRRRGFAFALYPNDSDGKRALIALQDRKFGDRRLIVKESTRNGRRGLRREPTAVQDRS